MLILTKLFLKLYLLLMLCDITFAQTSIDETIYGKAVNRTGIVIKESIISSESFFVNTRDSVLINVTIKRLKLDIDSAIANQNSTTFGFSIEIPNSFYREYALLDEDEVAQLIWLSNQTRIEKNVEYTFTSRFHERLLVEYSSSSFNMQIGESNPEDDKYALYFDRKAFMVIIKQITML